MNSWSFDISGSQCRDGSSTGELRWEAEKPGTLAIAQDRGVARGVARGGDQPISDMYAASSRIPGSTQVLIVPTEGWEPEEVSTA